MTLSNFVNCSRYDRRGLSPSRRSFACCVEFTTGFRLEQECGAGKARYLDLQVYGFAGIWVCKCDCQLPSNKFAVPQINLAIAAGSTCNSILKNLRIGKGKLWQHHGEAGFPQLFCIGVFFFSDLVAGDRDRTLQVFH